MWMTPYKMQNLIYEWVDFSKYSQIWAKIGSNLRKFVKNWVILLKTWPKIGPIGIWMGEFSWKIGICMGLLSNSTEACSYQNQTWVPPGILARNTERCFLKRTNKSVIWASLLLTPHGTAYYVTYEKELPLESFIECSTWVMLCNLLLVKMCFKCLWMKIRWQKPFLFGLDWPRFCIFGIFFLFCENLACVKISCHFSQINFWK